MIRILLVDDQPAVRVGLRMMLSLEADMAVVGEAGDGHVAFNLARALEPDVIVMDAKLPGMDGIAAIQTLRRAAPRAAVILLTMDDCAAMRARANAAGAAAFVGKAQGCAALVAAIRRAAAPAPVAIGGARGVGGESGAVALA